MEQLFFHIKRNNSMKFSLEFPSSRTKMKTEAGLWFSISRRGTHHSVFKREADIDVLVTNFRERAETHFFFSLVRARGMLSDSVLEVCPVMTFR